MYYRRCYHHLSLTSDQVLYSSPSFHAVISPYYILVADNWWAGKRILYDLPEDQ